MGWNSPGLQEIGRKWLRRLFSVFGLLCSSSLKVKERVWLRFVNCIFVLALVGSSVVRVCWVYLFFTTVDKSLYYPIIIWLILPVVIRSSQRLSHACVSINNSTLKLRMAHYISYSLLEIVFYLDNRSNSRANTWVNPRLLKRCVY